MRVLIIDDTPQQRTLYRLSLARSGIDVVEAESGQSALELDWTQFDVILCDILMPGMTGDEVIRKAAERWGDAMPPVIVFTALDARMIELLIGKLPDNISVYQKAGTIESILVVLRNAIYAAIDSSPGQPPSHP